MTRVGEVSNLLKPSIPYIEIGGSVSGSIAVAWNDLTWSFLYFQTNDFIYLNDGSIRTITTGLYKIEVELCLKLPNQSTSAILQIRILKNGVEVADSRSISKLLNATGETNNYIQLQVSRTVFLNVEDLVSFQFNTTNNTVLIADDIGNSVYYSRARISYIPLSGWNNDSGGSVIFRGVRR